MKHLLVAALTSSDEKRLERLIKSLCHQAPAEFIVRGVVVCNTLDESYIAKAQEVANNFEWDFYITESNGKPGKGKNSVLDIFTHNYIDFEYLLLMDGDDFLYPSALQLLERITRTHPDVVGLQTNDIIERVEYQGMPKCDIAHGRHLYSWHDVQENLYAKPEYWNRVVRDNRKLGEHSTPDRIILFSHNGAARLRCSEALPVYEDYIFSIQAQYEMLKGMIKYVNTSTTHIYVYDKSGETSTCKEFNKSNGDWSSPTSQFMSEINHMETVLRDFHASEVPFIHVPKPAYMTLEYKLDYLKSMLVL